MKIAENISWKVLQNKIVAVDIATGTYFTLNEVASEIWQAIDKGADREALLAQLTESYPDVATEQLEKDLDEQITYWQQEKLIV